MLRDVPAMAEGIGELPVAFAPELIGDLVVNFRPCFERARPSGVGVSGVDLQHGRRATDRQRRDDAEVGELAGNVDA
jgi:hypothetical protein